MSNNKQSSVDKEFVPYEEALALKELGFDEPCLAVTYRDGTLCSLVPAFTRDSQVEGFASIKNSECLWEDDEDSLDGIQEVATPTFSQAFRWFREKYNLHYFIDVSDGIWFFDRWSFDGYKTYEESELACLKKLIEIANEQQ